MSKPLVSLTVICYQAERYIQEAIDGALAQTYSPLEIIFSDDASPDRTFEIIQERLKDYEGPHRIVLNRNETNMGIGAHVSKVWFDIAQGDWIIVSAGDDVSLPHRVARLMEVARPEIGVIHHSCIPINEDSEALPYLPEYAPNLDIFNRNSVEDLIRYNQWIKGATMCLNKRMLLKYGRINPDVQNEDNVLAYRAQAFGGIVWLDEPLMKYRIHSASNTLQHRENTFQDYKKRKAKSAKNALAILNQVLDDRKQIVVSNELMDFIDHKMFENRVELFLYNKGAFDPKFLVSRTFYAKMLKRIVIRPYLLFFKGI